MVIDDTLEYLKENRPDLFNEDGSLNSAGTTHIVELMKQAKLQEVDFTKQSLPVEVPLKPESPTVMTGGEWVGPTAEKPGAGFFSSFGHQWKENDLYLAGQAVANTFLGENPQLDKPVELSQDLEETILSTGITNQQWLGRIIQAKTESDRYHLIAQAQQYERDEAYYQSGSWVGATLGALTAGLASPLTLMPMAEVVKYGKAGKSVVNNMLRVAPSVSAQAFGHNAFRAAAGQVDSESEFLRDTFLESMGGTILIGAGVGLMAGSKAMDIAASNKILKAKNMMVGQVHDEAGIVTGNKAMALPGHNVSAAEVDGLQQFLDSGLAKKGMFSTARAMKLFSKGNPIIQMKTSRFSFMRDFADKMFMNSFVSESVEKGAAKPVSIEEIVREEKAMMMHLNWTKKGLYLKSIGLDGDKPISSEVRRLIKQKVSKDGSMTEAEFDRRVYDKLINPDSQDTILEVNEAANLYKEKYEDLYRNFLVSNDLPEDIFPPRTAYGYMMQMYDVNAVLASEASPGGSFIDIIASEYQRQDELIKRYTAPINAIKSELEGLQSEKLKMLRKKDINPEDHKSMVERIKLKREDLQKAHADLRKIQQDDKDFHVLLDSRVHLSSDDEAALNKLFETQYKYEDELDDIVQMKSSNYSRLKQLDSTLKNSADKKILEDARAERKQLRKEIDEANERVSDLKRQIEDEKARLEKLAEDGRIDRKLYNQYENGRVEFKNPRAPIGFRPLIAGENYRGAARQLRDRIANYTPEQLNQSVLANITRSESTNPLKERTVMVPSNLLLKSGFLTTDMDRLSVLYSQSLTSRTALNTVMDYGSFGKGMEGATRAITTERQKLEDEILNNPKLNETQKKKEILKLNNQYKKETEMLSNSMALLFGNSNKNTKTMRFARTLRNYTAATRLGFMLLSSMSDHGAVILKHGLWNYISKGLLPMMADAFKRGKGSAFSKENAAHAFLASENVLQAYQNTMYNPAMLDSVYIGGKIESTLNKTSNVAMHLFGQSFVDNLNERMVANISQSKFMAYMQKYVDGTITKGEAEALRVNGLRPEEWAERFLEQQKLHGGEQFGGAYQTNWFNWTDNEAAIQMRRAIRRSVNETVLKGNWSDSPLWMNDGWAAMIFQFHKWGFSAMNKWILPSMQRDDASRLSGIVAMLGLGAMVDPLRKAARGEEYDFDGDKWFMSALSNSSILGWYEDGIANINALSNFALYPNVTDKRSRLTIAGILGGASGGLLDNGARLLSSLANGTINQQDVKSALTMFPGFGAFYLRQLTDHFIENTSIPKARPRPNPWYSLYQ